MEKTDITNSEWEVMRIVWTLGETTSSQLIDILSKRMEWSSSTIKTLLSRLCDKEYLGVKKDGRKNIYYSAIMEQAAYDMSVKRVFESMCCMHYGKTIHDVIEKIELSKSDIDSIIDVLNKKRERAPEKVHCKCLEE
ncbi:Transcriptional repressor CopY [Apilactobacillus kunkeei]|nr:Transcriptional repressor CopY [Apilactobacillus kunkeei]CAI2619005.1 Transcriptional repressor CopY [Apilactobacillus kunkeei]CAI2802638.1 Transcriptional repressor CopY [Apilactobacillus kunkeei]